MHGQGAQLWASGSELEHVWDLLVQRSYQAKYFKTPQRFTWPYGGNRYTHQYAETAIPTSTSPFWT